MPLIIVIAIVTAFSTALGGLFAIRFRDKLHLILGFSAGAVMGVAFFDLLPEAIDLSSKSYSITEVTSFIAIGFVGFMIVDRLFSIHMHEKDGCENPHHSGQIAATALCFHSFLDGMGIGLAFKVSPAVGWIVAAAVLAHDFSDGINTVNMILKNEGGRKQALRWLAVDALAPALGVVSTIFFSVSEPTLGLILAVFTGIFFFIGACDLIPESHHRHSSIWTTIMTILGMAVIYTAVHFAG